MLTLRRDGGTFRDVQPKSKAPFLSTKSRDVDIEMHIPMVPSVLG